MYCLRAAAAGSTPRLVPVVIYLVDAARVPTFSDRDPEGAMVGPISSLWFSNTQNEDEDPEMCWTIVRSVRTVR